MTAAPLEVWVMPADQLAAALARRLGGREPDRDARGKPFLPGGPHFNISHSGTLGLLALCVDTPVGVDLEAPRLLRNPAGLARRMCTQRELDALGGGADLTDALLGLWVRKEAVAKAQGDGIVTALGGLDVLDPVVDHPDGTFLVLDLPAPAPGFRAAVAWREDRP